MTHGKQPGRGNGSTHDPADSSFPPELSVAVLECDGSEAEAHLAALGALAGGMAGSIRIAEVTGTCLAIGIDVAPGQLARLTAGLKLGGATIMPQAARATDRLFVILTIRPPHHESSSPCKSD